MRAVATEAGCATGTLRYYFDNQDALLDFAFTEMLGHITARVRAIMQRDPRGVDRAQSLLEQLLPLDETRLAEVRVHLEFMSRERTRQLGDRAEQVWHGQRHLCALAVADVTGGPAPERIGELPDELVPETTRLQLLVDGLTFQGVTVPDHLPPQQSRAVLREALTSLAGGPATDRERR